MAVSSVGTVNCLFLHQFNELFFGDIWLPCLRCGKEWSANKVGKCCSSAHFVSKYSCCYCLLPWPHSLARLIHSASCSLPNISTHNLLPWSSHLHYILDSRVQKSKALASNMSAKLFSHLRRPHYSTEKGWALTGAE